MQVNLTSQYLSYKKKYKRDTQILKKLDDTIKLFISNYKSSSLQYKKINCQKDKNRYSIRVINTQYRILMTVYDGNNADLKCICSHDEYDRLNKNC